MITDTTKNVNTENAVECQFGDAIKELKISSTLKASIFIALLYAVRKADAGNAPPAVHVIGNGILIPVCNSYNLPSGVILVLLEGALAAPCGLADGIIPIHAACGFSSSFAAIPVPVPQTPDVLDFSIQPIFKCRPVSKCVFQQHRLVLQVVGKLLHRLTQSVGDTDTVAAAVIGIGCPRPVIAVLFIGIWADRFGKLIIPVIEIAPPGFVLRVRRSSAS